MSIKEYSVDYGNPIEAAKTTIGIFLDQLKGYRHTTPNPKELEWEIAVYEFMLEDPVARLKAYQDSRHPEGPGCVPISKRKAVASLGWKIAVS